MTGHHTVCMLLIASSLCSGCLAAPLTGEGAGEPVSLVVYVTVVSVAGLIAAIFGCACCFGKTSILKYEESVEYDDNVNHGHTNDAFADFSPPTQSTPSFPPGGVSETVSIEALPDLSSRLQGATHGIPQVTAGAPTDTDNQQPDTKHLRSPKFVFPRDQLNYVDELGNGWFGKVLQGEAHRLHPGMRKTRVVIKQLRDTATSEEQLLFLQEVQPYREVNHPNVLMLLGQCIENIPLLLVLEYAPYGDLKNYLRKNRGMMGDMAQKDVQLRMAHDIISGLLWLHQADFIHIDLGARNCQVCADTSVKIGDYGLALEKYPEDYYITKDECHAVPIRWLGPEVIEITGQDIRPKKITKASNVWSFGVIMLELSTGADRPYSDLSDEQVLKQVVMDLEIKLDKPDFKIKYADRWFEIMMFCWMDSETRPTVKEIHELLTHLKNNIDRTDMDTFETKWNALKPTLPHQSSSECSEASQDASQHEVAAPSVVMSSEGLTDPLSISAGPGDPLSVHDDGHGVETTAHQQVVSVDVTLPAFDDNHMHEDQLLDEFVREREREQALETLPPSSGGDSTDPLSAPQGVVENVIAAATPQANATPEVNSNTLSFDVSFDTPTAGQDIDFTALSGAADDSMDIAPKSPELLTAETSTPVEASSPFTSSLSPGLLQSSTDTSLSYDTAMGSVLDEGDSTITFTESFNAMSSNPFSSGTTSSEDHSGFVSALESAGDDSLQGSQAHSPNGFGDFEGSAPTFGTPSAADLSSIRETPTPTPVGDQSIDLLGGLSQDSNPFSNSASLGFSANVDSPAPADFSFDPLAQNGEDHTDVSLQSVGAIKLKDVPKESEPETFTASPLDLPHGYAEVSAAAKKPMGMTMLTVSSGKKKKSIEILKDEEEDEAADKGGASESSVVTLTGLGDEITMATGNGVADAGSSGETGASLLDLDLCGPGLGSGPGLSSGFGAIEVQVTPDGKDALVVQTQSAEGGDSDEFGSYEDVSKES